MFGALAGEVTLQPCDGAAGVDVQEVGLRGFPNVHDNVEVATRTYIHSHRQQKRVRCGISGS
jgi:hypothetical protein